MDDIQARPFEPTMIRIGFIVLCVLSLVLRFGLLKFQSQDYLLFLSPWYDFIAAHGLHSFKYSFSNYNAPYLYLLYVGIHLPLSKIVAIKVFSIFFDVVLAAAVYLVAKALCAGKYVPMAAAATVLFLPTVFLNSALWGQCDSIYTSFLVLSFYLLLKGRMGGAWALWGVALAFKLQAVFFLPVLLVLALQGKVKWYQPLYALGVFALLSFPPLAVGRSVKEILGVYVTQANSGLVQRLSFDAPNPYLWVPDAYFHYFNKPGVIMGLAVVLAILLVSVRAYRGSKEQLLYFATIFLLAVPFVLPQMHERYFYPAEIFSLLVAMSYPKRAWVMVAMQGITMMTYVPYLFGQTVVPLIFLPFGIAGILYRLGADLPATRQL